MTVTDGRAATTFDATNGSINIPAELRGRPQWVIWRRETRDGKATKVPYMPARPRQRASVTDPRTWGSYEEAAAAALDADGYGFVFTAEDDYAGIDLDACVDERGELHPSATAIVERLDSYTEHSPSGTGVHVITRGEVRGNRKRISKASWGGCFEAYDRGRFFTVTGHGSGTINQRQEQLDVLMSEMFPAPPTRRQSAPSTNGHVDDDDAGLLRRAFAAENGTKLEALWGGDISAYGGDDSVADLALCSMLAFWTGDDPDRLDALFRGSRLMRDKWDSRRGESTYGRQTIEKALQGRTEFYRPPAKPTYTNPNHQNGNGNGAKPLPAQRLVELGTAVLAREMEALVEYPAEPGDGRAAALQAAAARVGRIVAGGGLELQTTWQELEVAGHRLGLETDELERRIQSGLADGMTRPIELVDTAGPTSNGSANGNQLSVVSESAPAQPRLAGLAGDAGWPAPLKRPAMHGLAGEVVRTIEPHSEADPVALLLQYLVAFGNAAGRGAGFRAEADFHPLNLFVVLVGQTASGRKGTSWGQIGRIFECADAEWRRERVQSGASSGEGLIWAVRDPILERVRRKENGKTVYEEQETDPGVPDKRLLDVETEFASVLRRMGRDGNTLSPTFRQAWDGADLQTMTKSNPARARGAHISAIGHITGEELRRELTATEAASGFANRFIFACVKRSKLLPEGGNLPEDDLGELAERTKEALRFTSTLGEMRRDQSARELWKEFYGPLTDGKPGLFGAVTSRAAPQVMRLACDYAALDLRHTVGAEHLQAALALWDYSEQSARHIFGSALGDPLADAILEALRGAPGRERTRTELQRIFANHKSGSDMERALGLLERAGLATRGSRQTDGRHAETWRAN